MKGSDDECSSVSCLLKASRRYMRYITSSLDGSP